MADDRPLDHRVAWVALTVGAVLAGALMLYATARVGAPVVLKILFPLWVAAPFALLALTLIASKRWTRSRQRALSTTTIVVACASCFVYALFALGRARPPAAVFVLTPPASLLVSIMAVAVLGREQNTRSR